MVVNDSSKNNDKLQGNKKMFMILTYLFIDFVRIFETCNKLLIFC